MKKQTLGIIILTICILVTACGSVTSTITKLNDNALSDPKSSIGYQLELLKSGDADKLRACFTDRVRDNVTKDSVEKGKTEAAKYTLDDLVGSVETGEYEGKKTAKIKMKNGKALTTLIETNNQWLADTIWFK